MDIEVYKLRQLSRVIFDLISKVPSSTKIRYAIIESGHGCSICVSGCSVTREECIDHHNLKNLLKLEKVVDKMIDEALHREVLNLRNISDKMAEFRRGRNIK